LQQDNVAAVLASRDPLDFEEVEPGRADSLGVVEGVEQMPERRHGHSASGSVLPRPTPWSVPSIVSASTWPRHTA
jgi:hypothetical protein